MLEKNILENPLAVVGEEDVVLGFSALGFRIYPTKKDGQIQTILEEILKNKCAICLVQEEIYRKAIGDINSYKHLVLPIFIPFTKKGMSLLLDDFLREIRLRATGTF